MHDGVLLAMHRCMGHQNMASAVDELPEACVYISAHKIAAFLFLAQLRPIAPNCEGSAEVLPHVEAPTTTLTEMGFSPLSS